MNYTQLSWKKEKKKRKEDQDVYCQHRQCNKEKVVNTGLDMI